MSETTPREVEAVTLPPPNRIPVTVIGISDAWRPVDDLAPLGESGLSQTLGLRWWTRSP